MSERPNKQTINVRDPEAVYKYLNYWPDDEPVEPWVKNIDVSSIPKPDFPHSLHHVETVRTFSRVMAKICGLGEYWRNTLDTAAIYHDISQGYTLQEKVPLGPHNVASSVIAYMLTENQDVAELIHNHNDDNLGNIAPETTEMDTAMQILRDADRLSLMGYSGLIRSAYYWGFRHKLMDQNPKSVLDKMILCDSRCSDEGLPVDYEKKVRHFCLRNLFPFLIKTNQIDRAANQAKTNIDRFFGSHQSKEGFLSQLRWNKTMLEKALKKELRVDEWWLYAGYSGIVQETSRKYSHLFIEKPLLDRSILEICEAIQFRLTNYGKVKAERLIKELLNGNSALTTDPWED